MSLTTQEILFSFLCSAASGEAVSPLPEGADLRALYELADKHDLAHFLYYCLRADGSLPAEGDLRSALERTYFLSGIRAAQLAKLQRTVQELFDAAEIPYILLKGAVIRPLYPQPWMRTSGDLDVLIPEALMSRASELLKAAGMTEESSATSYHLGFLTPDGTSLEIHNTIHELRSQGDLWTHALPAQGQEYRFPPEFFALHHIAHMAKHFRKGGCGIRPFLDLWLLRSRGYYEEAKLLSLLERASLLPFYERSVQLCEVWFASAPHTEPTLAMEEYILSGGVYGKEQRDKACTAVSGSRAAVICSKLFPDRQTMKNEYPLLRRSRLAWGLLPVLRIHRIFRLLKRGRRPGRIVHRLVGESDEALQNLSDLFSALGLRE